MNLTETLPRVDVNLSAIDTKGFVVIRNFLSSDEVNTFVNDYNLAKPAENANYPLSHASLEALWPLREKVLELCNAVEKTSATSVDTFQGGVYFSIGQGINFAWHQDHESFFINQDHINYLNFYIVVIKEKAEESNLNVVPFDKLKEKSSEHYDALVGGGARVFAVQNGETHVYSEEKEKIIKALPFDIGTLSETPQLNPGDLLLIRGDVIHSTQFSNSARVALSIRMASSKHKLSLKKLVSGSKNKRKAMTNNRQEYVRILEGFRRLGVTEATYTELMNSTENVKMPLLSKRMFILKVLFLKFKLMF